MFNVTGDFICSDVQNGRKLTKRKNKQKQDSTV